MYVCNILPLETPPKNVMCSNLSLYLKKKTG